MIHLKLQVRKETQLNWSPSTQEDCRQFLKWNFISLIKME